MSPELSESVGEEENGKKQPETRGVGQEEDAFFLAQQHLCLN